MKDLNTSFCTFYVARHAHSEDQVLGVMSGHRNPILSEKGLIQADNFAKKLSSIHFDAIFSSDLQRAQLTAKQIALNNNLIIETTKLLRERFYGKLEGKKLEGDLLEKYKNFYELTYEERLKARIVPDMENDEEVIQRVLLFLRETAIAYPNKKVLITCHGNMMKVLLVHLGFAKYDQLPSGCIENTGYFILKSDGTEFFIEETEGIHKNI